MKSAFLLAVLISVNFVFADDAELVVSCQKIENGQEQKLSIFQEIDGDFRYSVSIAPQGTDSAVGAAGYRGSGVVQKNGTALYDFNNDSVVIRAQPDAQYVFIDHDNNLSISFSLTIGEECHFRE